MADRRLVEAQRWAENPDAWKEPARCNEWIQVMQEIVDNQGEMPEARAEAEMLVKRLKRAKHKPA